MRRRRAIALAATVTASLSGCLDGLRNTLIGPTGHKHVLSLTSSSLDRVVSSLAPTSAELSDRQLELVERAQETGTARTYGVQPFSRPSVSRPAGFATFDGRWVGDVHLADGFYGVLEEQTGNADTMRWLLGAEPVTDPPEEAMAIAELPEEKRDPVRTALVLSRRRSNDVDMRDPAYAFVFRTESPKDSGLAPNPSPEYVTAWDESFRLFAFERTITEPEYTYRLNPVADTDADFAITRLPFFEQETISSAQRDILDDAVEGSYTDGFRDGHSTPRTSEAFRGILTRLYARAAQVPIEEYRNVPVGRLGHFAWYDGSYYRARVVYDSAE